MNPNTKDQGDASAAPEVVETLTYISVAEACARLVSVRPGKRVHPSCVVRWIQAGKIRGRRRGRYWLACAEDLDRMERDYVPAKPLDLPPPRTKSDAQQRREADAWTQKTLERFGVI